MLDGTFDEWKNPTKKILEEAKLIKKHTQDVYDRPTIERIIDKVRK